MDKNSELELKHYEIKLNRWQAKLGYVLNSDASAVAIGLAALKTFIVLNAGSIISILAFIGQIYGEDNAQPLIKQLTWPLKLFLLGALSGAASNAFAYFYQSVVTEIATINLERDNLSEAKHHNRERNIRCIRLVLLWAMIIFAFTSFCFFGCGAFLAISSF
jgi:hypothetical protein